ncbi:MAG: di-heme enzyme [Deltaproteobacteria bacterium]|nr:di-heme enzyme [Deltaproteobacteria bacterium]
MTLRWLGLTYKLVTLLTLTACGYHQHKDGQSQRSQEPPELRELGRQLFSDPRLSLDGSMSCQSCHEPHYAYTDRRSLPFGVTGITLPRNSPSILYTGKFTKLTWVNPVLDSLEQQLLVPLFGENPPELHIGPREEAIWRAVFASEERARLRAAAASALGSEAGTRTVVLKALATYVSSLAPFASPYDRYLAGEGHALSDRQKTGLQLFEGKAGCVGCHSGPLFNGQTFDAKSKAWGSNIFRRNGLNNQQRRSDQPLGLAEFTLQPDDWNLFRVPSLRNVAETAPYLHDGSRATLAGLLQEYNAASKLALDSNELTALEDFLKSLSDAAIPL